MEELKDKGIVERPLMSEEEFENYLEENKEGLMTLHLQDYSAVSKFKSIRRAIKRGYVNVVGTILPKRPFNNTKDKKGSLNSRRKEIYRQLKHRSHVS